MRRIAAVGLGAGLVLALAAPALATTSVSVPARDGWVSTGITVSADQHLSIKTLGSTHTAKIPDYHVPGDFKSASGPAGQTSGSTCGEAYATFPDWLKDMTGTCAFDAAFFGELIGRVGGVTFAIGASSGFDAPAAGTIELAVNDLEFTYFDNVGAYTVVFR